MGARVQGTGACADDSGVELRRIVLVVAAAGLAAALAGCGSSGSMRAPFDATSASPLALTDDAMVVAADNGVWMVDRRGGRRRLFADPHMRASAASATTLAVLTSDVSAAFSGPYLSGADAGPPRRVDPHASTVVRGGPLRGPYRVLERCTGAGAQNAEWDADPVAGDGIVAATGCDGRSLAILDGHARRTLRAGGEVVALAAAGSRVGWIARPTADGPTVLHLVDLAAGSAPTTVPLRPLPADQDALLSLAADGRWRAAITQPRDLQPDPEHFACAVTEAPSATSAPRSSTATLCPWGHRFTDEGSIELDWVGRQQALVRRDREGRKIVSPEGARLLIPRSYVTDGKRIAEAVATCTAYRLVASAVDDFRVAPEPDCPITVGHEPWPVSAVDTARVPISCPHGCRLQSDFASLFVGPRGHQTTARSRERDVILAPGGSGALTFAIDSRAWAHEDVLGDLPASLIAFSAARPNYINVDGSLTPR
jgi:hypothetical protein